MRILFLARFNMKEDNQKPKLKSGKMQFSMAKHYYCIMNSKCYPELVKHSTKVPTHFGEIDFEIRDINSIYDYGLSSGENIFFDASGVNHQNIQVLDEISKRAQDIGYVNIVIFYHNESDKNKYLSLISELELENAGELQLEYIEQIDKTVIGKWANNVVSHSNKHLFRLFDKVIYTLIQLITVFAYSMFPILVGLGTYFEFNGIQHNVIMTFSLLTVGPTLIYIIRCTLEPVGAISMYLLARLLFFYSNQFNIIEYITYASFSILYFILFLHVRTYFDDIQFSEFIFSDQDDYSSRKTVKKRIKIFENDMIRIRYLNRNVYRPENPSLCSQAFISHRNTQIGRELSLAVKAALEEINIRSYLDFIDIKGGFSFRRELSDGLRRSGIFISILTDVDSISEKEWVQRELQASSIRSLHSGLPIIIVLEVTQDLNSLIQDDPCYSDDQSPIYDAQNKMHKIVVSEPVNQEELKTTIQDTIREALQNLEDSTNTSKSSINILRISSALTPYCLVFLWISLFLNNYNSLNAVLVFLSSMSLVINFGNISTVKIIQKIFSSSLVPLPVYLSRTQFRESRYEFSWDFVLALITLLVHCFGSYNLLMIPAILFGLCINMVYGELFESYHYVGLLETEARTN